MEGGGASRSSCVTVYTYYVYGVRVYTYYVVCRCGLRHVWLLLLSMYAATHH